MGGVFEATAEVALEFGVDTSLSASEFSAG
jgi:hypothetical protein